MPVPVMKENQLSPIGKVIVVIGIVGLALVAGMNIARGDPQRPMAFAITLLGFVLFLAAKLSVVRRRGWISFGTDLMSPGMADAYRVGYWLMGIGILATFL